MKQYICICPTEQGQEMLKQVPWMLEYLLKHSFTGRYDDALYCCWCHPLDEFDQRLQRIFANRYDYRYEQQLHTLYNELTREITIIIVNRYQILLKCDKIPLVVTKLISDVYPTLRIFCNDENFEEVKI